MPALTTLAALLALAATAAPSAPPSQSAASRVIAMPAGSLQAEGLDPALRDLLPGLISAALASGTGYDVSADRAGAGWELTLSVSGRGPWRLTAQLQPLTQGRGLRRFSTKKHPITGREDLGRAVDALASEIDQGIRAEGSDASSPTDEGAPLPLARALSSSTPAVDAYLAAMSALRGGDASKARGSLETALKDDPSFCMAAVELAYLDLTGGSVAVARPALEKSRAGGPCQTPLAESLSHALDLLARGDAGAAVQAAGSLRERAPSLRWGRLLHGLALSSSGRSRETLDDWRAVTSADPADPRGQMWLGLASMTDGDFKTASQAFARARGGWPDLLLAYTLQAESQARLRDTAQARQTLTDMKSFMTSRGIVPDDDLRNPDVMLGAVDLLEGHTVAALRKFETALDTLEKTGAPAQVTDTLHNAVIEMKRDLIIGNDAVARRRQIDEARAAIERYQTSQTPEHRLSNPWELMKLTGLIDVREGSTAEAWKVVEEIKSHAADPGYSEYYEAYLSAAILMKEGDDVASTEQFDRAAKARGRIVDLVDLAQMQGNIRRYKESHDTYEEIARRLARYDPSPGSDPGPLGELIVGDPHLAAMIPIYHYTWARLAYETNNPTESRQHFNLMLKYLQSPDPELIPLVKEAYGRGAHPE